MRNRPDARPTEEAPATAKSGEALMPLVAHHNQIDLDPGEWLFEDGVLWACLPCGHLWAANHPANSVRWDVSGPPEAPTARPSVHCHGGDPRGGSCWHGWLTAGEWKEA